MTFNNSIYFFFVLIILEIFFILLTIRRHPTIARLNIMVWHCVRNQFKWYSVFTFRLIGEVECACFLFRIIVSVGTPRCRRPTWGIVEILLQTSAIQFTSIDVNNTYDDDIQRCPGHQRNTRKILTNCHPNNTNTWIDRQKFGWHQCNSWHRNRCVCTGVVVVVVRILKTKIHFPPKSSNIRMLCWSLPLLRPPYDRAAPLNN